MAQDKPPILCYSSTVQHNPIMQIPDSTLVLCIADALWGDGADTQWSADTLEAIAEAFRQYRPDLVKEGE